ncbi:MAG: ABC transporter substrate-binding protein [Allobranchiibius sp.]
MTIKRTLTAVGALTAAVSLAACGGSGSGSSSSAAGGGGGKADFGKCKITSKAGSLKLTPAVAGTLTVQTTLPAQGWWNGTTADSIKDGYEYCMGAELANMAGLKSITVKNVAFAQLVAGRTNNYDIALAEISITPERQKVVDFSTPYYDSNVGVLAKKTAGVTEANIKDKRCGAYSGTTSVPFIQDKLKCKSAKVYPNSQTLYQAVISGQIDAAFLDTAIVLAEAKEVPTLAVVGQFKTGEKYGAIYPKASKNKAELDKGIKTLMDGGTLKTLTSTYLGPAFGGDPSAVPVWKIK